jgi:hypothetical protein
VKKISVPKWTIPAALLALCAIAYGPLILQLGLYWDDWPSLWFLHFYGPTVFPQAFAIDRPLQGWLFVLTTSLIGENLLAWHLFGIITRWISGLALGWVLYLLWPNRKMQVVCVTALFLVYPGFMQQYIPITYGHQFIILSLFLVSLGIMILGLQAESQRKPARYWMFTVLSVLSAVLSMFALEYFYGLELLRPVLIWLLADRFMLTDGFVSNRRRLGYTLKHWLPYALADALFLGWRLTHSTPRGKIVVFDKLLASPLETLANLSGTILQDIVEVTAHAWAKTFAFLTTTEPNPIILLAYWLVVLSGSFLLIAVLSYLQKKQTGDPAQRSSTTSPATQELKARRRWGLQASALGVYALLIAGWPIWVTKLHLELAFPWDRFTLLFMLGASLLLVGLLELLIRPSWLKIVVISLIAGLAMGAQFRYAMDYRQEWQAQKDFFWQLAWRVPGIQPGTLLLLSSEHFTQVSDNSLTAPVNWIYAPAGWKEDKQRQMAYLVYNLAGRLGTQLPALVKGIPVQQDYRATYFSGNTSQSLVIYYEPPRCLKVIDPYIDRTLPNRPNLVTQAMPLSRPDLILPNAEPAAMPPEELFGSEPTHDWCYYFEKAELARQRGDWEEVTKLAQQAFELDEPLTRRNAYEVVPFIEGYAHTGDWKLALEWTQETVQLADKMPYVLCDTWLRIAASTPESGEKQLALRRVDDLYGCQALEAKQ